jgi:hypothetical protein
MEPEAQITPKAANAAEKDRKRRETLQKKRKKLLKRYGVPDKESPFSLISHPRKRAFLTAYSRIGMVVKSATIAGCAREMHQIWLKGDPQYAELFEVAQELSVRSLEDEAIRRAKMGVNVPVFYQGKKVATKKEYSDFLLGLLLKAEMPDKYRERISQEVTNPGGQQLSATHNFPDLSKL